MVETVKPTAELTAAIDKAVREITAVREIDGSTFVSVPLFYPSGSFVTIRIDHVKAGLRVSDGGFAYREIESIGAQKSFGNSVKAIVAEDNLNADRRQIFVDVPFEHIIAAVCDVAAASWRVTDRIYARAADAAEQEEGEIADSLRERLSAVFGVEKLRQSAELTGASTTKWPLSAVVVRFR